MTVRQAKSFCRICPAACAMTLTIDEDEHIVSIRGDHDHPVSNGYACFKGLQAEESHRGSKRLLHPLKRQPDGSYARIGLEQALDEIAEKIAAIMAQDGPEAIAQFLGNGAEFNASAPAMVRSFSQAIGSSQYFTTHTIDQSAKFISFGRLGGWGGGMHDIDSWDCALIIGANPLVTHGPPVPFDPIKQLKKARARGFKMITIDPRETETSHHADLVLQPIPGQDPAIIGGLIRLILAEGWEDAEFCERYVGADRMAALRDAVAPLTTDYVEARAGLKPGQIRAVAEMFGRDCRTGVVFSMTGTNMAPFSNMAQHLADCLNIICGRVPREGDPIRSRNPLLPPMPIHAMVIPPSRFWEPTGHSRIRGANSMMGERMSGTLSDEILTPGKGRIRALIVDGGDPATSLPDQRKALEALRALDLLVSIEPWPTLTAGIAHYVLPPKLQYERADVPFIIPGMAFAPGGFSRYAPPVLKVPRDSDLTDDWYVYWSIAKRLGVTITYDGKQALDMEHTPSTDDLLAIRISGTRVTLDELKKYPMGHDFGTGGAIVLPPPPGYDVRFDVIPADVAGELRDFLSRPDRPGHFVREGKMFSHLLSTRRLRDFYNNNGVHLATVRKRNPYNPAFLNPEDLTALGIEAGQRIEISSAFGSALAIAGSDPGMRRGVVSLAHGWNGSPEGKDNPEQNGTSVNLLVDTDRNFEPINAMPHMSAVPVNIRAVPMGVNQ